MASTWYRQSNCFLSRFNVNPSKREEFVSALMELCGHAEPWYEEGCQFAFQGWARDPHQWVAIAAWKSEDILKRMRETPWFKDCQLRMLECCTGAMVMEQFNGMDVGRSVFDVYPVGSSKVHMKTTSLDVVFV